MSKLSISWDRLPIAISVSAALSIFAIYVFQYGYFTFIGLEFIGLLGITDVLYNLSFIAPYIAVSLVVIFLVAILFEGLSGYKYDPSVFITRYRVGILAVSLLIPAALFFLSVEAGRYFTLSWFWYSFLVCGLIVYSTYVVQKEVLWWYIALSLSLSIAGVFLLGYITARNSSSASSNIFNINVDGKIIENVRLLRTSSVGIIYYHSKTTTFVNMSKVNSIASADEVRGK